MTEKKKEQVAIIKKAIPSRAKLPSEYAKEMASKGSVKLSGFESYQANPFMTNILKEGFGYSIRNVEGLAEDEVFFNTATGEVKEAVVGKRESVDREPFTKIFATDINTMLGLSPAALKIYMVLLQEVQKRKDEDTATITLYIVNQKLEEAREKYPEDAKRLKTMGKSVYYEAIKELMLKNFIANSKLSKDIYYINPAYLFNGNRITLAKQYVIKDDATNENSGLQGQGELGSIEGLSPYKDKND